jgi:trehalose-phosphatase
LRDDVEQAPAVQYDDPRIVAAKAWARVRGRHLLLLTDYDGTLSELAPTPADAVVSNPVLDAFGAMASQPHLTCGVVSGRPIDDVAARVQPAVQYVAGIHGLEIRGHGEEFSHRALDEVEPVIARLAASSERRLAWCKGCFLENKRWALTCHVRLAAPDDAERALEEFEDIADPYLESRVLRLLIGSKAVELLPAVDWHKGRAVEWIRTRVGRDTRRSVSVIYLGDDRTDEDAFTALSVDDFAIGVGDRPHSHMIDARLAGPAAVGQFFEDLKNTVKDVK